MPIKSPINLVDNQFYKSNADKLTNYCSLLPKDGHVNNFPNRTRTNWRISSLQKYELENDPFQWLLMTLFNDFSIYSYCTGTCTVRCASVLYCSTWEPGFGLLGSLLVLVPVDIGIVWSNKLNKTLCIRPNNTSWDFFIRSLSCSCSCVMWWSLLVIRHYWLPVQA